MLSPHHQITASGILRRLLIDSKVSIILFFFVIVLLQESHCRRRLKLQSPCSMPAIKNGPLLNSFHPFQKISKSTQIGIWPIIHTRLVQCTHQRLVSWWCPIRGLPHSKRLLVPLVHIFSSEDSLLSSLTRSCGCLRSKDIWLLDGFFSIFWFPEPPAVSDWTFKNNFFFLLDKIDAGLYKDYQERVGFFKGLIQEDLKEAVDFRKTSAAQTASFAALKEGMPTSLKDSMQLQLEAAYRWAKQ